MFKCRAAAEKDPDSSTRTKVPMAVKRFIRVVSGKAASGRPESAGAKPEQRQRRDPAVAFHNPHGLPAPPRADPPRTLSSRRIANHPLTNVNHPSTFCKPQEAYRRAHGLEDVGDSGADRGGDACAAPKRGHRGVNFASPEESVPVAIVLA